MVFHVIFDIIGIYIVYCHYADIKIKIENPLWTFFRSFNVLPLTLHEADSPQLFSESSPLICFLINLWAGMLQPNSRHLTRCLRSAVGTL